MNFILGISSDARRQLCKNQKCSKYFIFLVTMATNVGGVARYEKKPLISIFELLQPFPHIETYTVNGKF